MTPEEINAARDHLKEVRTIIAPHLENAVSMFTVLKPESNKQSFTLKCIDVKRGDDTAEFDRHLFNNALDEYLKEDVIHADIREALEDKNKIAVASVEFFASTQKEGDVSKVSELCDKARELSNDDKQCESFTLTDIDRVLGIIFRYAVGQDTIYAYQKIPRMWVAKKTGMLIPNAKGFRLYTKESLRFGAHFDFLICADRLFARTIATLEQQFGFTEVFRNHATVVRNGLSSLICDEKDFLQDQIDAGRMSVVRKLVKVQSSPVLEMERAILRKRLSEIPAYQNAFTFDEDDKIVVKFKKDIAPLLKMLNDEIVHSQLTDVVYESPNKTLLQ
ncbi:Kiwa anti-phage protein KwaB-like domain-containing protein [Adlercreutzia caecimuris]|uniref:DUF4868 domain-containing protein n=1 Tax=Adlercreutzia caecimuris B7 TaxID=1235794 RepID=R9L2Z0_9ACTN|nr:Kiwa anti-phage protein KwaB-like domain-containing protein [Adlercreutzia caecimuris]EOS52883.1 hypothetical protein C811_00166 [Adlercreutzia caecimuris B7]